MCQSYPTTRLCTVSRYANSVSHISSQTSTVIRRQDTLGMSVMPHYTHSQSTIKLLLLMHNLKYNKGVSLIPTLNHLWSQVYRCVLVLWSQVYRCVWVLWSQVYRNVLVLWYQVYRYMCESCDTRYTGVCVSHSPTLKSSTVSNLPKVCQSHHTKKSSVCLRYTKP